MAQHRLAARRTIAYTLAIFAVLSTLAWPAPVRAQSSTLLDGLVSCWDFEESTSTRYDSVGSNHLTDINTVTRVRGVYRYAAEIVAANTERLQVNSNSTLVVGDNPFSVAFWFLTKNTGTYYVVQKYNSQNQGSYMFSAASGIFRFVITNGTPPVGVVNSPVVITANTWWFVVGWYDPALDKLYIQIDDALIGEGNHAGGGMQNDSSVLQIGYLADINIDSLMLWQNKILTSGEKTWLYNGGFGRSCSELLQAPTPTPQYRSDVELSSGNHLAIDRTISFEGIAIVGAVLLVGVLLFILGVIRIPKLWL